MTEEFQNCWYEGNIIAIREGESCRLPDEPEYEALCNSLSKVKPVVSDASLELSQGLGFLPREEIVSAKVQCDADERLLLFQAEGVSSPVGIFTFNVGDSKSYTLVVYPKIFDDPREGLRTLFYTIERVLLEKTGYSLTVKLTRLEAGGENLFDIWMRIIYLIYIKVLSRELLKGAYHEYTRVVWEDPRVSGKILVSKQVRRPVTGRLRIIQESYPYSLDNTLNRVLKYAANIAYRRLLGMGNIANEAKRILSLFSDVRLDPSSVWVKFEFNRLSERFEIPYRIAQLIIFAKGLPGEKMLNGILIDMNVLFERYVYSLLKQQLRGWSVEYQKELGFASIWGKRIKQRPDLVLKHSQNNTCIVLDVKYSVLTSSYEPSLIVDRLKQHVDDLRQIFTYHTLLENLDESGCSKGAVYSELIYLAGEGASSGYARSVYGAYETVARQKCFKVTLLSPKAIAEAAENPAVSAMIEEMIAREVVDIKGCG
ncbi:MAG: McrC family protein [Desulfurococcales archaeon]|nr:McrC family protein [Desulfurococcales archaeon]